MIAIFRLLTSLCAVLAGCVLTGRVLIGRVLIGQLAGESVGSGLKARLGPIRRWAAWVWSGGTIALIALVLVGTTLLAPQPAQASLTDDTYDGNIFALYAGNGSLVPPRTTLSMAFDRQRPALLLFYVDDSRDCKQFSSVYSQLQAYYGRAADFLPLSVDTLDLKDKGDRANPATYYRGVVPQLVIFDQAGQVVFDEAGQVPFESIDDRLRDVFDLLPRSESVELRRRSFNEVNTELVPE